MLQANVPPTQPRSHIHEVLDAERLTEATYRLRCDRQGAEYRAGQHVNLGVPGAGVNREYSVYSGPNDPFIEFLIREVDGGIVSPQLTSLRPGDSIELHGFYGDFCIRDSDLARRHTG